MRTKDDTLFSTSKKCVIWMSIWGRTNMWLIVIDRKTPEIWTTGRAIAR